MMSKLVTFRVDMRIEIELDEKRPYMRTLTIKTMSDALLLKIAPHAVLFLPHIEYIEEELARVFPDEMFIQQWMNEFFPD